MDKAVKQAKEISEIFNSETRHRNYKKTLLNRFGDNLGKIAINLIELSVIPNENKYIFLHQLIQLIDMYRLNVRAEEMATVNRNYESPYFDRLKKQIASSETEILIHTDSELIEALNIFIEKSKASLNTWESKALNVGGQYDPLKYKLALSFISVLDTYTRGKKMNAKTLEFAASFFCNLGYGSKDKGNLIPYDTEYMREIFKEAISNTGKNNAFYQVVAK